jgi:hypothetical protein
MVPVEAEIVQAEAPVLETIFTKLPADPFVVSLAIVVVDPAKNKVPVAPPALLTISSAILIPAAVRNEILSPPIVTLFKDAVAGEVLALSQQLPLLTTIFDVPPLIVTPPVAILRKPVLQVNVEEPNVNTFVVAPDIVNVVTLTLKFPVSSVPVESKIAPAVVRLAPRIKF